MRVRWLRKALINLDEELSYIASDDPEAARVVASRIFAAIGQLPHQPASGRPGRVHGTRELVVRDTRYIIPYRIRGEVVEILRVFHASRRLPERW